MLAGRLLPLKRASAHAPIGSFDYWPGIRALKASQFASVCTLPPCQVTLCELHHVLVYQRVLKSAIHSLMRAFSPWLFTRQLSPTGGAVLSPKWWPGSFNFTLFGYACIFQIFVQTPKRMLPRFEKPELQRCDGESPHKSCAGRSLEY